MTSDLIGKIWNEDCLETMKRMEDKSVDLIVTDPPYSSGARQSAQMRGRGAMLRADKWEGKWFGTDNLSSHGFMFFFRGLALGMFDIARDGAHLYAFIDWRNYPLLSAILESAGWRVNNMLVWDKEHFGMGRDYRNQHELIIFASKGDPKEATRHDVGNVLRFKRMQQDEHPTEKPVDIISTLVGMSSLPEDVVFDPFMGSGTTAVACEKLGRRWIGSEINPDYCKTAEKRIEAVRAQGNLFEVKA